MNKEWNDFEWIDFDPDGEWDWEPEDDAAWEEIPAWYMHHYEADEPIYGEYTAGGKTYVSGSGDWLDTWYEKEHGRQLRKKGLRKVTSFPSPRVRK